MTPLQFAKAECANYRSDACSGIGIHDDGSLYSFGSKPACLLASRRKCRYFEECVLPMGIDNTSAAGTVRWKARAQALRLYATDAPTIARKSGRLCPTCRERELEVGKHLCYACRDQREKASQQARTQKWRHMSTDSSILTADNQPLTKAEKEGPLSLPSRF